jgi:hypothetical protein
VNEPKCRDWVGGVVGDRRVGSVDEISRETHRRQNGVHGCTARRTAPVGVRASVVARKRVMPVEPRDAGRWKQNGHEE